MNPGRKTDWGEFLRTFSLYVSVPSERGKRGAHEGYLNRQQPYLEHYWPCAELDDSDGHRSRERE